MKVTRHLFFPSILLLLLVSSCMMIGLNVNTKTPAKETQPPKFGKADYLKGKIGRYRRNNLVHFYELSVEFDLDNKSIIGEVDMHFATLSITDTIQIDLYDNMKINEILHEKKELAYYRKHNAVFVIFNRPLPKEENHILTIHYEGKPKTAKKPPWKGGFVWSKDKSGRPLVAVACESEGASLWWPLKDHLYDEPDSMLMHYTIPKGLFCVSNGKLIKRTESDFQETFTWKVTYPINTYNATFYIGDYQHFTIPFQRSSNVKAGTVFDLDFYALPSNLMKAADHFEQVEEMIDFFEYRFGDYPWIRDGFKLVESPFEGMEHQTAIAYGAEYKNTLYGKYDYIILHETAHEWFGNSVSTSDFAEIWLHEGFATYAEALFLEDAIGIEAYRNHLSIYRLMIMNKQPIVGPSDVNYWNYKDSDVYLKGALLLHTLRNTIDDDYLFFEILQSFHQQYKYMVTNSKSFIDIVSNKTGKDYTWFFNHYLYNRAIPVLEYYCTKNKDGKYTQLHYKWADTEDDFKLPIKVFLDDETSPLYPTTTYKSVAIKSGVKPMILNFTGSYFASKETKEKNK